MSTCRTVSDRFEQCCQNALRMGGKTGWKNLWPPKNGWKNTGEFTRLLRNGGKILFLNVLDHLFAFLAPQAENFCIPTAVYGLETSFRSQNTSKSNIWELLRNGWKNLWPPKNGGNSTPHFKFFHPYGWKNTALGGVAVSYLAQICRH